MSEQEINHEDLQGLSKDDHTQYIHRNPTTNSRNRIVAGHYEVVPLNIKGALGHHEHLVNYEDFHGNIVGHVDNDGSIHTPNVSSTNITADKVEAQNVVGWAASLESLFSKEIKVGKINDINFDQHIKKYHEHVGKEDIHYTQDKIDHKRIQNAGRHTHNAIDDHLDNRSVHFEQKDIDHKEIQNAGHYTHSDIDAHLSDGSVHFTAGQVSHGVIKDLDQDHHKQYLLCNGTRSIRDLRVQESLTSKDISTGKVTCSEVASNKATSHDMTTDDLLVQQDLKVEGRAVTDALTANELGATNITASKLKVSDIEVGNLVDGVNISEFFTRYTKHMSGDYYERHPCFNYKRAGFVPSTFGVCDNYTYITSNGEWKSAGEYLGLYFIDGELESVSDAKNSWSYSENQITIPFAGIFEIKIQGIQEVMVNGEELARARFNEFFTQLNAGDVLSFETNGDAMIQMKRIDSYG